MSAVTVVRTDGLTIDLSEAIRSSLDTSTIPSTGFVAMIDKVQRVTLSDGEISSIDFEFDTNNYKIKNAEYSNGTALEDSSLTSYQVRLDSTTENLDEAPTTGQHLYVSFIYVDTNTTERVRVTNSGIQYSKYRYGYISNISVDSGFLNFSGGIDGTLSIDNFNQPVSGTSYLASYSYTAPKEGERITVSYNYNRLISDSIFTIESVRPVTADVLVKQAQEVEVDVSVEIVALPTYSGGDANLIQSTQEAITNFLNSNSLGTVVDASDLINAIYDVVGVDRVEILTFNNSGSTGVRQSIEAESNQYITSGTISVTIEER